MTCEQCRPLLSHYYDGVLELDRRTAVRRHMESCEACTLRLAGYDRLNNTIASAVAVVPRPSFRNTVLAATSHRGAPPFRAARPPRGRRGQILFGAVTGAMVAAMAILIVVAAANVTSRHRQATNLAARGVFREPIVGRSGDGYSGATFAPHNSTAREKVTPGPGLSRIAVASGNRTSPKLSLDRAALLHISHDSLLVSGAVHSPLWSPDSSSLLYLTNWNYTCRGGWYCGVLEEYNRGTRVRIAADVRSFAWSPDGMDIAYAAQATSATSFAEPQDLHIVSASGTGSRVVIGVDRTNVEWLPIGIVASRFHRLVLIDPASGTFAPLSELPALTIEDDSAAFFALSPSGRFLAYQDGTGLRVWDRARHGIQVLRQPLSKLGTASFHFSWSGDTLFYSTYDKQYTRLYRQALASAGRPAALNNGLPLHGPINLVGPPTPDNSVVNFRIGTGATALNYVIDASHGRAHALLPPEGVGPVGWWSPDGKYLVYMSYRGDTARFTAIAAVDRS